jgi:prephenate dehydrogenase
MSEKKPIVTIVGLGRVGASIGLILRNAGVTSEVIGHDRSGEASNQAKKAGAVDRTHWNLLSACEKSQLVILALPFAAMEPTLRAIGPHLRSGCVVVDTATLKGPVLQWAAELLPESVHFVGLDPILPSGSPPAASSHGLPAEPRPDLFQGSLICVVPSERADPDAVKLAIDLVAILGAKPLFCDAHEHDGLMALADQLPSVLALALVETAIHEPTWREVRKLAGGLFETATQPVASDPAALGELCRANRENVVRWLDALSAELTSIRAALADDDASVLSKCFEEAERERNKWLELRAKGEWGEATQTDLPKLDLMHPFVGGLFERKPKSGKKP